MRALFHPVTFVLAIMSIQWVTLATLGPFSVKPPYLALGVLAACTAASPRIVEACLAFGWRNAIWLLPYLAYLLILTLALWNSPGANIAPRQMLYLVCGVALAGHVAAAGGAAPVLRWGAGLGILLFVAVVEIMARGVDLSWWVAISHFLTTGDLDYVVYSFFRTVFNANALDGDIGVVAAHKNGLAVTIFIAALLVRIGGRERGPDWLGIGVMILALFLILLLNTRSVMIVAALCLVGAEALRAGIRRGEAHPAALVLKLVGAATALLVGIVILGSDGAVTGTLQDRFAFEDNSTAARVTQFRGALERIDGAIITGNGYSEVGGHVIHNLFLSAWVHAGLPAFLLTLAFYVAIVVLWADRIRRAVLDPNHWVLPVRFEWVAVLPILPLFRVWLSGDAGHLFLGEWIALMTFFGIVLGNDMALTRDSRGTTATFIARGATR